MSYFVILKEYYRKKLLFRLDTWFEYRTGNFCYCENKKPLLTNIYYFNFCIVYLLHDIYVNIQLNFNQSKCWISRNKNSSQYSH